MIIPESILISFVSVFWTIKILSTFSNKTFTIFVPLSYIDCSWNNMCIFYLLGHVCIYIYSCQYFCMYIVYILNVLIWVNELILSFLLLIQCKCISKCNNTNIEPWWVWTLLNILSSTNQLNISIFFYLIKIRLCYTLKGTKFQFVAPGTSVVVLYTCTSIEMCVYGWTSFCLWYVCAYNTYVHIYIYIYIYIYI